MPKIPTKNTDQQGINVGSTPRINTSRISNPEMGMGAINASNRVQKDVVNTLENIEDTFVKVREFRQKNEADAYVFEKLNAVKAVANEDINFDSTVYETEIEKIGTEASKTITGGLAKVEFMANFRKQAIAVNWEIKNSFREKELVAAEASIEYKRKSIAKSYAGMTPAEQITAVANFKTALMDGVKKGIYNQATANLIDLKFQQDVQESVVDNHIIANPGAALVGLKEGKDGPYPGISEQFRTDSIEKAAAYDKKYTAEAEAAREKKINANEDEIIKRLLDPSKASPSEGEMITLMNNEDVSPEFTKKVIDNIRTAKKESTHTKSIDVDFAKIMEDINKGIKTPDKIRNNILELVSSGNLNEKDASDASIYLSTMTNANADKLVNMETKSAWFGLSKFAEENIAGEKESRARMSRNFLAKLNSGTSADAAAQEAIRKEVLYLRPEAKNYPDGMQYMDSAGSKKLIMPNGDLLSVESAGAKYMKSQEKK